MMRVWLIVTLAACHELPDLGVCGNGIVEADNGEACDGGDTCTETCVIACQPSAVHGFVAVGVDPAGAQQFCPDDTFRCGVDNVCRARSGRYQLVGQEQDFDAKSAAIGDFDGDHVDDLIGTSPIQIEVRFGTASGTPFADGFVQDISASVGLAAVFDRDPDTVAAVGTSDLGIAIPNEGIAVLGSNTESFAPELDVTLDLQLTGKTAVVVSDPDHGDVVITVTRPPERPFVTRPELPNIPQLDLVPCGNMDAGLLHVAVAPDRKTFVVVARDGMGGWIACKYDDFTSAPATTAHIPGALPTSAVLANVSGDACLELVVTRNSTMATGVAKLDTNGSCGFTSTVTPLAGTMLAKGEQVLAAGQVVPGGFDEIVMTSGVYTSNGSVLAKVVAPTSDRSWVAAALTDFDADGALDVVAGREAQEDVDVVRGGAIPNVSRANTQQVVTRVVAGDFNGGGFGDAALVEGPMSAQRVSILYGAPDGPISPAQPTSDFGDSVEIARLSQVSWGGTARGHDGIDDLLVARATGADTFAAGVLVGEKKRMLTMPRFPATQVDSLGALVIGPIPGVKLAAVTARTTTQPGQGPSAELETFDLTAGTFTPPVAIAGFEVDTARTPALLRTADAPVLVLVGSDTNKLHLVRLDGTVCDTVEGSGVVHAVDIDGDGIDELAFGDTGKRQVHIFPITSDCHFGPELLTGELPDCTDVIRVDDLLLTDCQSGLNTEVFRIVDGKLDAVPFATLDGLSGRMIDGDFNGDGVRDVAVSTVRAGAGSIHLLRQCPAHDTRGCK